MRWYKRLRVYTQLALACTVTVALLFGYVAVALGHARQSAHQTFLEYAQSLSEQTERMVEAQYDNFAKILRLVSFDKDVQEFLLAKTEAERIEKHSALKRALIQAATLNAAITDIMVEDGQGRLYNLADSQMELPQEQAKGLTLSGLMTQQRGRSVMRYLVMGRNIESIDSYDQTSLTIGNVYLVLTDAAFTGENQSQPGAAMTIYLTDGTEQVVWSSGPAAGQTAFDRLRDGSAYYCADTPLQMGYHLFVIQQDPEGLFTSSGGAAAELVSLSILLLLLAGMWVLFARNLVRPLRTLSGFVEKQGAKASLGALHERVALTGYQEAGRIGEEVNALLDNTVRLTGQVVDANTAAYESKLLAKRFELAHLRSEINPHFLYNTLETMVGIAYANGQPDIAEIARSLSIIFKYSIKGKSIVPLREEWKIAQNYLTIQHYRFSDRFDVSCPLPRDCADVMVPKLILQPMIENAIVHGIEQQEGRCHLAVDAHLAAGDLVLTVKDDGAGMPPEQLAELNRRLADPTERTGEAERSGHVGILNVDSRLKLQYGPGYGVTLESTLGGGTTVELRLPAQKEDAWNTQS